MRLKYKLLLTLALGMMALVALLAFKQFSNDYFVQRNAIELSLKAIDSAQKELDYQILHNAFFLYINQDDVNNYLQNVQHNIESLLENENFRTHHASSHKMLEHYLKSFEAKKESIYTFQTANAVIKNTLAAIGVMQQRLFEQMQFNDPKEHTYLQLIQHINQTLLGAKNSMDTQLIESLMPTISTLSTYHFNTPVKEQLAQLMLSHIHVIIQNFGHFAATLGRINTPTLSNTLQTIHANFLLDSQRQLQTVNYFSYALIALFTVSLSVITLFLFQSEHAGRIDRLTGLGNRRAYEERIQHSTTALSLFLINIRKFKHYNDFYGVAAGDKLLQATARHIQKLPFAGESPTYYRLGADDFGILCRSVTKNELKAIGETFLQNFGHTPLLIEAQVRTPSIVIAASNYYPLLETADMALKSHQPSNPIIYHEGLNLRKTIEENLNKVQTLKRALELGNIIPYFQPIVRFKTHTITKHEVLARIIDEQGNISSIYPYLHTAKEASLYAQITRTMLLQTFPIIANHEGDFSINLSIDDIGNTQTVEMILTLLREYNGIGKRIIFEILESEAVQEYEDIAHFITLVRQYGCKIAIDDFGYGYSNFSRILNLVIDIIKIDGSLIQNLDSDPKAVTIVQTIVNFTKSASIETVAEFVHSREVAQVAKSLCIDAAQGFYFYTPMPTPTSLDTVPAGL